MAPTPLSSLTQSTLFTDVPYLLPIAIVVSSVTGGLCVALAISGFIFWRKYHQANKSSSQEAQAQIITVTPQLTITDTTTLPASTKTVTCDKEIEEVTSSPSSRISDVQTRRPVDSPRCSSYLPCIPHNATFSLLPQSSDPNLLHVLAIAVPPTVPQTLEKSYQCNGSTSIGVWWHDFHKDHSDIESLSTESSSEHSSMRSVNSSEELKHKIPPLYFTADTMDLTMLHDPEKALLPSESEIFSSLVDENIVNYCWELADADRQSRARVHPCKVEGSQALCRDASTLLVSKSTRIFENDELKAIDPTILTACWKVSGSVSAQSLGGTLQSPMPSLSESDYLIFRANAIMADMVANQGARVSRVKVNELRRAASTDVRIGVNPNLSKGIPPPRSVTKMCPF